MMKNLIISIFLLSFCFLQGYSQFAEPAVTGASFVPNQIDQGQSSMLTVSFANTGSTAIPAGSIEVTIATADTYYTTDQTTPPTGSGGDLFTWNFIGGTDDIWRGSNTADISAFGGGDITVTVTGVTVSNNFETTNINVQPVSDFSAFTDAAGNNNLQPSLKINTPSCIAGSTAPSLSQYIYSNWCPEVTVDLDLLHDINDLPGSTDLIWSMDGDVSDGLTSTSNPLVSSSGRYYAYYYDSNNDCYSPASDAVDVTIDSDCFSSPIAVDAEPSVVQDGQVIIDVLSSVAYSGTDSLSVSIIGTSTAGGNFSVSPNGLVTYEPIPAFAGVDSVQYQVCDDNNMCDTAYIIVNVLGFTTVQNNCPEEYIILDSIHDAEVPVGTELIWSVDADASDGLDDVALETQYSDITLYMYYHDTIADCYSPGSPVILEITICNNPPTAENDENQTQSDTPVSGNVLQNDTDFDDDDMHVNPVAMNVTGGTVTIDSVGNYTFSPSPGFEGDASFGYEVCDSGLPQRCDTALVTISVTPFFLIQNTCPSTEIDISDIHDGPMPTGMTVVWSDDNDESDGLDSILPSPQMVSDTLYMYYLDTIAGCYSPGTPIILEISSCNEAPLAVDDSGEITQDSSLVIDVQDNDSDPDDDDLTTSIVGTGSNQGGTVTVLDGDSIIYTPPSGYSGIDTITYRICDSGSPQLCDTAYLVITIIASPVAKAGDDVAICEGSSTNLLGSASEGDGNYTISWSPSAGLSAADIVNPIANPITTTTYTMTIIDGNNISDTDEIVVTVNSNIGNADAGADVVLVSGDSTMLSATGGVSYVWAPTSGLSVSNVGNPKASPSVNTTYVVTATDSNGCTDTDEVPVTVVDGEPPHIIPNPITVLVDSTGEVCMTIYDLNEGDTFSTTLCADRPDNGNAIQSVSGNELCVSYTPDSGYAGSDEICVIVCDQRGLCDTVSIPVTVIEPLPPSVTPEPPVVIVTPIVVPENDSTEVCTVILDPNIDVTHTATLCTDSPENGTAMVAVENGNLCLMYKPAIDYVGEDEICVIVCDNTGLCDTVQIPVTVVPELLPIDSTQPPVVVIPPVVVPEDSMIMVCAPIVDANSENTHTVTSCGNPENGTVTTTVDNINNEICISYIPDDNFSGDDEICLIICDNTGLCDTVIIPVTIIEDENQILAEDDGTILISGLVPDAIDILANDVDNEGNLADISNISLPAIVDAAAQGNVEVLPDGSVMYTAEFGASGIDSFTYVICDLVQTTLCDTATVMVFITSLDCDQAEPGVAKASDVSGEVGEQASFVLEDYAGDEVTWSIASTHAIPNSGTGDATGLVTFTSAGEFTVVFTVASNASPTGCSNPSTVFATTRYVVSNPIEECDAPTYSPVDVSPLASAIFKGDTASFVMTHGQPYTSLTWAITPTTGVSSTVGFATSTGPVTFDSSGVYMIQYNYINIGDGTCEPVEGTATAYVNVGLNPCSAPTPVLVASNPNPSDGTIATGETVTWTAGGGAPGSMTWEIVNNANVVIKSGTGNTASHIFNLEGDYYIIFTSNNDTSPSGCTQVVGTSETKKIIVEDRDPPVVTIDPIEVEEGDDVWVCADIVDPNPNDTYTAISCGGPYNGMGIDTIEMSTGELCIYYKPALGFSGQDSMCVLVCDNTGLCDTVNIPITVTTLPEYINAEDDGLFFITGLNPDTISVLNNDTSNDNTPAHISNVTKPNIISGPSKGVATVLNDGTITYVASIGAGGTDSITYVICDINNPTKCDTAVVELYVIVIDCQDAQPGVATAAEVTGEVGRPGSFVLENYVGDEVTWEIASPNAYPNSGTGASTGNVFFTLPGIYTVVYTIQSHSTPEYCNVPSTVFATTRYIVTTPIPECASPTFSPVDISPNNAAVFVGDEAEFELTNGQPYTSLTWAISPSTGVNISSGTSAVTGPVRFDSSGTYTIQYTYVNSGDGSCEPVEATATGFVNVGLNPCSPPSPIQISCNPAPYNGVVFSDQDIIFSASGGVPGVLTWDIVKDGAVVRSGNGNTMTHSFASAGDYQVVFSSTNTQFPTGCTQKLGTSETKTVTVEDRDAPEVELQEMVTVRKDSVVTVCASIVDADTDNTHTATSCGDPENGESIATVNNLTKELCIEYTPDEGFTGLDSVCIMLCDNTGLCDTIMLMIDVERHNDPPIAINDTVTVDQEGSITIDVLDNDSDINDDDLTTRIISGSTSGGTATVVNGNEILYNPENTFSGIDTLVYEICDNGDPILCDTAMVYIHVTTRFICLKVDAKVYLEGSLIVPDGSSSFDTLMRTDLNDLRILPGQSYSEGFFADASYSTPGQPYNSQPYLYLGSEGDLYDSEGDLDNGDAGYPSTVVDWVLVSVRRDVTDESSSLVCQQAALLHNDGSVELVADDCCLVDSTQSFYMVIEHRSHLMVMTSDPVDIVDQTLTFDFSTANSYRQGDINFGALVGNGQKEVIPGVFAMFGGNGEQRFLQNDTDITAEDQLRWIEDNGKIASYRIADFNMNGDINFNDVILWNHNNGKFTTVPRDKNQ